jgi:hypothetical protein
MTGLYNIKIRSKNQIGYINKIVFKTKIVTRNKEVGFIMIKWSLHQKDKYIPIYSHIFTQ